MKVKRNDTQPLSCYGRSTFFFYLFRKLCFTSMPQYRYKHEPLVISSLIKSQNIAHHEQTRELV